jgi:Glycosyl hydrolase family 26
MPFVAVMALGVGLVAASSMTAPHPRPARNPDLVGAVPDSTTAAAAADTPMLESDGGLASAATSTASGGAPGPSTSPAEPGDTEAPRAVAPTGPAATTPAGATPTAATPTAAAPTADPTPRPTPKPTPTPTPPPATGAKLVFGAWAGQPWDPSSLNAFANKIGGQPALYLTYVSWNRTFHKEDEQAIANLGAAHVVTWEPRDDSSCYTPRSIANGDHDAFVRAWAKGAASWGKTIYLRPMHEMNGDWYCWGRGWGSNTAADLVNAWRHLHDIFDQEGATKVKWVWCPNVRYGSEYPISDIYPGSAYVDWTCLDGYNWGTDPHLGQPAWQSFATIYGSTYNQVLDLAPSKPMMIGEMASTEHGGDKAAWITKTYLTDIPKYSAIKAVVWFNQADGNSDFRINSSADSLAAFKQVYESAKWSGKLP